MLVSGPDARRKCENCGFIRRLINHTAALLGNQYSSTTQFNKLNQLDIRHIKEKYVERNK